MTKILDGKTLAWKILTNLKKEIKEKSLKLKLAVILIGKDPISQIFIRQKEKFAKMICVDFKLFKFSATIKSFKLKKEVEKIVEDPENSGIVIQLPLSRKFTAEEFLNLIPEEKDVDVLSEKSLGKFYQGTLKILPPTVNGILDLLKNYKISLKGKKIVIIGAGRLVGLPLAIQLLKEKATVSILNEFTRNTLFFTKKADILISGVGRSNLIHGKILKKGVVVIDVGISMKKRKLIGDVDFKSVFKKASYITPVPGGVGPMTIAYLFKNLVKLKKIMRNYE